MQRLLIWVLFLVASVWLGLQMAHHPGWVIILYSPWTMQMPLWFAGGALILLILMMAALFKGINGLHFLWYKLGYLLKYRRSVRSASKTHLGQIALLEGEWRKAEHLLVAGAKEAQEPLMNYLGAAKAAHEQKADVRRDQYLQQAQQYAHHGEIAIEMMRAEFAIADHQLEQALAILTTLIKRAPKHPTLLRLLEKIYVRRHAWQELLLLIPQLEKAHVITALESEQLTKNTYIALLHALLEKEGHPGEKCQELKNFFSSLPKKMRKNADVVVAYVQALSVFPNTMEEREQLIRQVLKEEFSKELVLAYGKLEADTSKQLIVAEGWLKQYGQHPEIFLTLGRLCSANKLWGKSKEYFEKCISMSNLQAAYCAYGDLLKQLGQDEKACSIYREGLEKGQG